MSSGISSATNSIEKNTQNHIIRIEEVKRSKTKIDEVDQDHEVENHHSLLNNSSASPVYRKYEFQINYLSF